MWHADFDKQKVAVTEEALAESQATSTGSTEGAPAGADQVAVDMPEEGQVGGRHSQESSRGSFKTPKVRPSLLAPLHPSAFSKLHASCSAVVIHRQHACQSPEHATQTLNLLQASLPGFPAQADQLPQHSA